MSTCLEVDDHEPKVKCMVHYGAFHSALLGASFRDRLPAARSRADPERSLPNMVGAGGVQDSALQLDAAAHAQIAEDAGGRFTTAHGW